MFSIVIPTLNNLPYLKLCLHSIKKNSFFDHEVILHINDGSDGTLEFAKTNNIKYSYSEHNSGICEGVNNGSKLATKNFILYAHDDFYFCPNWDSVMMNEVKRINSNYFYLSGTMMYNGQIKYYCGDNLSNFDEEKLLKEYKKIHYHDFQGSTWAPHLIHRDVWNKVGGFSEEFYPGTGSDPDLNMKLWNLGVRIFKGLGECKVYHFGSIVTRKNRKKDNAVKTESGSKGNKIFLLKWGITIKFFTEHYLKGCKSINGELLCRKYDGELPGPRISIKYLIGLLICKLNFLYLSVLKLK